MKRCSIVIGSLFGDEGKGHMTDILCSKSTSTINVRFNGGTQASHTVTTPDKKRKAFSHFGSGTFTGAKTYLSKEFIVNIYQCVLERKQLIDGFNVNPVIFVHPDCIVSTNWDIYINQAIETIRGDNRHGSCGFGINESVKRSRDEEYKITVKDLFFEKKLREKLKKIKEEYVPKRLKERYNLEVKDLPKFYQEKINSEEVIDMFCFFAKEFLSFAQIKDDSILESFENCVFEGAQGLLLDQNYKEYSPFLTTSNTGIKNVMDILKNLSYNGDVEIFYMSRCYMTRHGNGPFPTRQIMLPYKGIKDLTNVPNEFQGTMRFGILNMDILLKAIKRDLESLLFKAKVNVVFTCIDQMTDNQLDFLYEEKAYQESTTNFLKLALKIFSEKINYFNNVYYTKGETRNDMHELKNNLVAA